MSAIGVRRSLTSVLIVGTISWLASPAQGTTARSQARVQQCGPTWEIVPSPNPGDQGNALAAVVSFSASDAWAAGSYNRFNPFPTLETRPLFLHWDGADWTEIPNGSSEGSHFILDMTAIDANDLWAVGLSGYVEHSDGLTWNEVPAPTLANANLWGVAGAAANDVWAVGQYFPIGETSQTFVGHWDGVEWTQVTTPNSGTSDNYLFEVVALSSTSVWAVGYYYDNSGVSRSLVERWDGLAWAIVPTNDPEAINFYAQAVGGSAPRTLLMAGWASKGAKTNTLIERWNGSQWRHVRSPNIGGVSNYLYDVSIGPFRNAWAVGKSKSLLGSAATLIERFSTGSWAIDDSADVAGASNELDGVTVSPDGDVWAVGDYVPTGQPSQTLIEHLCP